MMKMMAFFPDDRGMTLLEILVAITVLCVGLLAVAVMFPTSSSNIDYGGKMSKATALAQEKIEEFRNTSFDSIASGNDAPTGFTRTWSISDAGTTPFRLRTVTVTVSWPSALGRPHNVVLQSFIAENK
ncbi:MAG: type II secretion system protein [bacterium]|jgi:prepilin-type N-terminal cleavage/methylation domain-containing protein